MRMGCVGIEVEHLFQQKRLGGRWFRGTIVFFKSPVTKNSGRCPSFWQTSRTLKKNCPTEPPTLDLSSLFILFLPKHSSLFRSFPFLFLPFFSPFLLFSRLVLRFPFAFWNYCNNSAPPQPKKSHIDCGPHNPFSKETKIYTSSQII
jgi:hypothetical protein